MGIKKGNRLIAAAFTLVCVIGIIWGSCTKPGANLNTCNYYICQNGGYCSMDTFTKKVRCFCPVGYEGSNCAVRTVDRYVGTWNMMQVLTGSDSMKYDTGYHKIIDTSYYVVMLKKSATPTTFFIDNFSANPYYNNIICSIDTGIKSHFIIDTFSSYHLMWDNYHLVAGQGNILNNDSMIRADLITRHLSPTSNWVNDTFAMFLTRHTF